MSEVMTETAPADLAGLADRFHMLSARVVAAEVEARKARAAADEADECAGEAVVSGDAEAMRRTDAAADAARATLAKARRDHAALARARDAALSNLGPAVDAERMALRIAADRLIEAAEARFKTHVAKAAQAHSEALAVAFAVDHPNAPFLAMVSIPSDWMPGSAPLQAGAPGQTPPDLPKGAAALAETAALLRQAERLLSEIVIEL